MLAREDRRHREDREAEAPHRADGEEQAASVTIEDAARSRHVVATDAGKGRDVDRGVGVGRGCVGLAARLFVEDGADEGCRLGARTEIRRRAGALAVGLGHGASLAPLGAP